jgi:hypothetical protein
MKTSTRATNCVTRFIQVVKTVWENSVQHKLAELHRLNETKVDDRNFENLVCLAGQVIGYVCQEQTYRWRFA